MALKPKPKPKPRLPIPQGFDPAPGYTAALGEYNTRKPQMWQDLINSDPLLGQDLANILGEGIGDRSQVQTALRQALIKYGGAGALRGVMGQLGGQPGFEDLLDETTLGAAQASDQAGTSIMAQLEKAHQQRLLAEEDIRAAKGMGSSGQVGYEIGNARQADTINRNDAVGNLLEFIRGGIGGFASRESARNTARGAARGAAAGRVADLGLDIAPPPVAPVTTPQMMQQLIRNAKKPPRRAIGGWDF